jgi:hypothetical protein
MRLDTVAERKTERYKEWREKIIARDGHQCKECLTGVYLQVHHIKPSAERPDLYYDDDNAVTLCKDCHFKHHRCFPVKTSKGASYKKYLKITIRVVAEHSGRCEETIRRHVKKGTLDLYSLGSIVRWINKYSRKEAQCYSRNRK